MPKMLVRPARFFLLAFPLVFISCKDDPPAPATSASGAPSSNGPTGPTGTRLLEARYTKMVMDSNRCSRNEDCDAFMTGWPFGCAVAVHREHSDAIQSFVNKMQSKLDPEGKGLDMLKCEPHGKPFCSGGRCGLPPVKRTRGAGGLQYHGVPGAPSASPP